MLSKLRKLGKRSLKSAVAPVSWYLNPRLKGAGGKNPSAGQILILAYHRVVADIAQAEREAIFGMVTSAETFRRHLQFVRERYEVLTLAEAGRVLRGESRVNRPAAVVTLDDGYRDVYDHAWPVLRALGIPATVFVPTAFIGTSRVLDHDRIYWLILQARACGLEPQDLFVESGLPPEKKESLRSMRDPLSLADHMIYLPLAVRERVLASIESALGDGFGRYPSGFELLDWEMVCEMAEAGIDFGAHTDHHVVLTLEAMGTAKQEILGSKRALEERLGRPVRHFAYPNGEYHGAIKSLLAQAGFDMAVTTARRINRVGDDLLSLGRISLCEESTRGVMGRYSNAVARLRLAA